MITSPFPAMLMHSDEYELTWNDITEHNRTRFTYELNGAAYADNWPYDTEINLWRQVFKSYPESVQRGQDPPSSDHHSGVFYRQIREALEAIKILRTAPTHHPILRRANAEIG
jgi:hypothetical protein